MAIFFKENLKFLRKQTGRSQTEIASCVNKGHTTIGNWENGVSEPNITEITQLSHFFDINVEKLLYSDLSTSISVEIETPAAVDVDKLMKDVEEYASEDDLTHEESLQLNVKSLMELNNWKNKEIARLLKELRMATAYQD